VFGNLLERESECRCEAAFEGDRLVLDGDDCPGEGRLESAAACRASAVAALEERDVEAVCARAAGFERAYEDGAAALLVAAGRFADAVAFHDEAIASRAREDPLGAARVATGRGDLPARIAAETGLASFLGADYGTALRPHVGPTIARSRVATRPPDGATLEDRHELETAAVVRRYAGDGDDLGTYHVTPAEHRLDADATATLTAAYERLARGSVSGGERAASRAVRAVAEPGQPVETLVAALEKHTRGLGVVEDCFADPAVTDVFATAPVDRNRLRVRRDGETLRTNVRLTADGAAALASRFRRASGRAFSEASPTLAATADAGGRRVRVAGVTDPVSDGVGFTFRAHDEAAFRLADLVENGTLSPAEAGFLSVATERGAALLLAGARGAGKTTLLGALLWELPPAVRTVVIEDTPELPVEELQGDGRDVQPLRVATGDGASIEPTEALRTALRLGDGALVVGEVRGEEARVLYEAMRVGAADGAVLGTIHGGDGRSVRERVVTDLGVPASAFADTDLVVTLEAYDDAGDRRRRVRAVEEVGRTPDGVGFASLRGPDGSLDLADSRSLPALADPTETVADVRAHVEDRTAAFREGRR
jgi:type IV secretory pathway ATPase VirB11/archaellum biosynthesis ATPase